MPCANVGASNGQRAADSPPGRLDVVGPRSIAGVNLGGQVDTYERYVYLHGTNHEARIGEPLSSGCVLMRNLDIVELYEDVRGGDHVMIVD